MMAHLGLGYPADWRRLVRQACLRIARITCVVERVSREKRGDVIRLSAAWLLLRPYTWNTHHHRRATSRYDRFALPIGNSASPPCITYDFLLLVFYVPANAFFGNVMSAICAWESRHRHGGSGCPPASGRRVTVVAS